jgi:transcriptional regulator with XRE-family HTH domain
MGNALHAISPEIDPGAVLAKAAMRAARELGLSQADLAAILGLSPASVSRMKEGGYSLSGKPYELAACLVRVFRSLDAIVAGDGATLKGWIAAPNTDLGAPPKALMRDVAGLIDVMNYLDAARAPL